MNQLIDPEMSKTVKSNRAGPKAVQNSQERVKMMVTETNVASCPTDANVTDVSIESGVKPYPTIAEEDDAIGTANNMAVPNIPHLNYNDVLFKIQLRSRKC